MVLFIPLINSPVEIPPQNTLWLPELQQKVLLGAGVGGSFSDAIPLPWDFGGLDFPRSFCESWADVL